MTTEGLLQRDGTLIANSDLSAKQFYVVRQTTTATKVDLDTAGGVHCIGVLQNKPQTGQACDIAIFGISKAIAGTSTINANDLLMTDTSSRVILRTGTNSIVGVAREGSTAVNQVISINIIPMQATT